jgi:hypothetical protein
VQQAREDRSVRIAQEADSRLRPTHEDIGLLAAPDTRTVGAAITELESTP